MAGFLLGLGSAMAFTRGGDAASVALAGPIAAAPGSPGSAFEPTATAPAPVNTDGRPFKGKAGARVDVVEFMDYECPFCRRHFESTFAPLLAQYGTRVRYVVMNFPIPELHPGAMPAAEAAECANQQGKFWEMHERLLRTEAYDAASLKRQATALKLDRARFDRCLDSGAMRGLIKQHQDQGIALGVSGTPAFFINGRKIEGAMPLGVFAQAIEAALAGTTQ